MKTRSILRFAVLAAVAGGVLAPKDALAQYINGYVCNAEYDPRPANVGNYGLVYVGIWTARNCTGTFVGGGWFCSTGATNVNCATDPNALLGLDQIMAMWQTVQRASSSSQYVSIALQAAGTTRALFMIFYAYAQLHIRNATLANTGDRFFYREPRRKPLVQFVAHYDGLTSCSDT